MAAVKSVPLGQTGRAAHPAFPRNRIEELVKKSMHLKDDEIGNFAPNLALLSARHETQYSRLFRS
jgi:urease accessory protein